MAKNYQITQNTLERISRKIPFLPQCEKLIILYTPEFDSYSITQIAGKECAIAEFSREEIL